MVARNNKLTRPSSRLIAVVLALSIVLVACGGGSGTERSARVPNFGAATDLSSDGDHAALALGAKINRNSLDAAEQQVEVAEQALPAGADLATLLNQWVPGDIAPRSAYTSGQVAAKAAAVRIPAFRFFNGATGAHFYTTSTTERDHVQATLSPPFASEGTAFSVASAFSPGLAPVHRFFNMRSGVHFFTISEAERQNIVARLPHFRYEGVAYHASEIGGAGLLALYRFYVPQRGFHFYTASVIERDAVIATLGATYTFEGIGYHVLASDWRPEKLPHTGVLASACFQSGNNELTDCANPPALMLNPRQDGHLEQVNAFSYSTVDGFSLINCVRDNLTGLVWEGKEPVGERSGFNTYTSFMNASIGDVSAYVARVNELRLCGFTDWRMPTRQELLGLIDYGRTNTPRINATWFPNTSAAGYWSAGEANYGAGEWSVDFSETGGWSALEARSEVRAVRLVRTSTPFWGRFGFDSQPYGADAPNNVVNDAWTGLQWRRCEQGRTWTGSTCAGPASTFSHQEALEHARLQSGWRLPNIREMATLVDLGVAQAARIDPIAFPGALNAELFPSWSSTPTLVDPVSAPQAWSVNFHSGAVSAYNRNNRAMVRLVKLDP